MTALRTGMAELAGSDTDPRRAVIDCWVRMERAAELAGTSRLLTDTPTDLVCRLLATHRIDGTTLDSLAELYRQARFGPRAVDERMRSRARSALRRVLAELETGPVTADSPGGPQ